MTDVNVGLNDLELEYKDTVKDPNDPVMQNLEQEVPQRYKEKSRDDLIDMHVNLEKVLSRQGQELGQLRKTVDTQSQLLVQVTAQKPQTESKRSPVTAESLLNDPVQSVNQVVEQNPQVAQAQHRINQLELSVAKNKFEQRYPAYTKDLNDPEFQSWVLGSPIRSKLCAALDSYNFEAGGELWDLWQEHSSAKTAAESARQSRVQQASSTIKSGPAESAGKPIYSRQKLADLQTRALNGDAAAQRQFNDPTFQREYQLAYAEQRVR